MQRKPTITAITIFFVTIMSIVSVVVGMSSSANFFGGNVQSGGGFVVGGYNMASSGGGFIVSGSGVQSNYSGNTYWGNAYQENSNPGNTQTTIVSGTQSGPGFFTFDTRRNIYDIPVSIIAIDYSNYYYLGGRYKYICNLDFYDGRTVVWTSSDPKTVYVDTKGNATVLGSGLVTITARDDRGNVSTIQQNIMLRESGYTKSSAISSHSILRLVNDKTGAYIYSADELEINAYIYSNTGWRVDKNLGTSGTPTDTPVFRAVDRNTGKYSYTTDRNVYVALCDSGNFLGEGIIFFIKDEGMIDWEKM